MPIEANLPKIAEILNRLSKVFLSFHERDIALQDALSRIEFSSVSNDVIKNIQHLDLVTQSHFDFSKLLQCISESLESDAYCQSTLLETLTLRSLKDELFFDEVSQVPNSEDITLF